MAIINTIKRLLELVHIQGKVGINDVIHVAIEKKLYVY